MAESTAAGSSVQAPETGRRGSRWSRIGFGMVVVGILTMAVAAFGYRFGLLPLQASLLALLPAGAIIAIVGAAICLILVIAALVRRRTAAAKWALLGLAIGAVALSVPISLILGGTGAPQIHDVTTDIDNPPAFVDAVPLRKATGARNPPEYVRLQGRTPKQLNVPEAQRKAFPDIQPLVLVGVAPDQAFERAAAAVEAMGWHLIAAKPEEGRIEAWDQTFWFGFIDDVSIRVTPVENGSRIDVRSLSRIGGGDAGTNAKRVRAYLAAIER